MRPHEPVVSASRISFAEPASDRPARRWIRVVARGALLSLLLLPGKVLPASSAPIVDFLPYQSFPTGAAPIDVKIADLNGDGHPDLAVANDGTNTVSVLSGDGTGSFGPKTDYTIGGGPHSVAIADLNGDGKPDLAVTNYLSNTVSVLINDGAGHFGARTDFGTGNSPFSVAIADMNNDGKPDLVVANYYGSNVSVLLSAGSGSFNPKTDYAAGAYPSSVVVADFDQDGNLDVAVAEEVSGKVGVFMGSGGGVLAPVNELAAGSGTWSIGAADLNLDGKVDLVAGNFQSGTVSVFLGQAGGSFAAHQDFPAGDTPRALFVGDVNSDGFPDVVLPNDGPGTVSVLTGDGTGALSLPTAFPCGPSPYAATAGDVNQDGAPDIAVASLGSSTISVLLQIHGGPPTSLTLTSAPNPSEFGGAVTLTANVSPAGATGSVSFLDGPLTLGSAPLVAGTATLQVTSLTAGTHDLGASYLGDTQHGGSTATVVHQVVHFIATVTTASSSAPTVLLTQPVSFAATVQAVQPQFGTPGGSVRFTVDGNDIGSAPTLDNHGTASSYPVTSLAPGGHSVVAHYPGSGNFGPSDSAPITVTVSTGGPVIAAVRDVPNDQGGHVFITWDSPLDAPGIRVVTGYRIWRRAPNPVTAASLSPLASATTANGAAPATPRPGREIRFAADGYWESIATLPAEQLGKYAFDAATTQDSMTDSNPYTAYFVTALTSDPYTYYESAPDSGYSVDNLAPPTPPTFTVSYEAHRAALHWVPSTATDFREFRLYRGGALDFVPGPQNLVTATRDTGFVDAVETPSVYKLDAVDIHGNTSRFAVVSPDIPVAALASLVNVIAWPDRIELLWYSTFGSGSIATVYRRTEATGWSALGTLTADGLGYLRFRDLAVQAGTSYGYRLGINDGTSESFAGEIWATPESPRLALEGARPNPARGGVISIAFTLPAASPTHLELLDVTGRRVASTEVGSLGPGRHTWNVGAGEALPPSIYLVRLTQGSLSLTRRVVMLK